MMTTPDYELARIREVRLQISREFNDDPDLLAKHYMELQERHKDRLVYSAEAGVVEPPKDAR
jgi:hypothetical protein